MSAPRTLRILLAGNPNCGKTSLFNALTGARHKVGNYPGITVEKRSGKITLGQEELELIDLPGTYSLAAYSPEERVAQEELLTGENDVVVLVADATNLRRGLVLLAQLLLIPRRIVLVLNMFDESEHSGQVLDLKLLQQLLGFPVVTTVGHKGIGLDGLRRALEQVLAAPVIASRLVLGETLDNARRALQLSLGHTSLPASLHDWTAIRLLLDDPAYVDNMAGQGSDGANALLVAREQRHLIEENTGLDVALYVTDCNFGFVDGLLEEVVKHAP